MRQTYLKIFFVFSSFLALQSCQNNNYDADISEIEYDIEIRRFEKALIALDTAELSTSYEELKQNFPLSTELFIEQILGAGKVENPNLNLVKRFVSDSSYHEIVRDIQSEYADLKPLEEELIKAFKHVKYYFPKDTLPTEVNTFITGMALSAFTYEGLLGISLDRFMGEDYKYYFPRAIPNYMAKRMRREYITPQAIKTYFTRKYPQEQFTDGTLLADMIYLGKQLEFVRMMCPNVHDTLIIEYSQKQLKWCQKNEPNVFTHFVNNKLFYETDHQKTFRYITDGPYTVAPDVPAESAPRIGEWIGWQIVKNYQKNAAASPTDLFHLKDAKQIFKAARYKPVP